MLQCAHAWGEKIKPNCEHPNSNEISFRVGDGRVEVALALKLTGEIESERYLSGGGP